MYGEKLKKIRKQLSETQESMAGILGISARTYAAYERNENNPPYFMLDLLCRKYDINLNWFIADVGEMFQNENTQQKEQLQKIVAQIVDEKMREKGL